MKTFYWNSGYNQAIGQTLGTEGAVQTGPDLTTLQPVITAMLTGNAVQIGWGWGGNGAFLDLCEIQVDRGSGWTLLAFDTTPNYTDGAPIPATPVKWKYRATAPNSTIGYVSSVRGDTCRWNRPPQFMLQSPFLQACHSTWFFSCFARLFACKIPFQA